MKNIVKHNAGKNLLAQSSESTGSFCSVIMSSDFVKGIFARKEHSLPAVRSNKFTTVLTLKHWPRQQNCLHDQIIHKTNV